MAELSDLAEYDCVCLCECICSGSSFCSFSHCLPSSKHGYLPSPCFTSRLIIKAFIKVREISVRTLLPDSPDLDLDGVFDDSVMMTWNKTEGLDYAIWLRPMSRPGNLIVECEVKSCLKYSKTKLIQIILCKLW